MFMRETNSIRMPSYKREDVCMRRAGPSILLLGLSLFVLTALTSLSACRLHTTTPPLAAQAAAPAFTLDSTAGSLSAQSALSSGPLVLVFYRGHW